jgi:hypothetical protein
MIMAAALLPKDRRAGWQPRGPQLNGHLTVQFFPASAIGHGHPPHLHIREMVRVPPVGPELMNGRRRPMGSRRWLAQSTMDRLPPKYANWGVRKRRNTLSHFPLNEFEGKWIKSHRGDVGSFGQSDVPERVKWRNLWINQWNGLLKGSFSVWLGEWWWCHVSGLGAIDDFVDEPADCNQLVQHKNNSVFKKIKNNFVKLPELFFFKSQNNVFKLTKFHLKNGNNFLIC